MSDWTRSAVSGLGEMAMQLGLTVPEAYEAFQIGARFRAHGFNTREIDYAIASVWDQRAEDEAAVNSKTATVAQLRRVQER